MNSMRMAKFETMVEDIDLSLKKKKKRNEFSGICGGLSSSVASSVRAAVASVSSGTTSCGLSGNTALALIYKYDKCNDYAKVIMDKSTLLFTSSEDRINDIWKREYPTYGEFKDAKKTIEAAKKLVQLCRTTENRAEGYKFIFWALMILTVDKKDAEEHLALICDFAKMLNVSEDEFEDIIKTIKIVYNDVDTEDSLSIDTEYEFKSADIARIFLPLFDMYEIKNITVK